MEIEAREETPQQESRSPFKGALIGISTDHPLYRGVSPDQKQAWQLVLEGGILSQFNIDASSDDLLNTDFLVGFPFLYRNEPFSARFRIMHQSSHLGDELLLRENAPKRINLSVEFAELALAYQLGGWRFYGGGGDSFRQQPSFLDFRNLHGGIEYVSPNPQSKIAVLGGMHYRTSGQTNWSYSSDFKAGLRFRGSQPHASVIDVLLEYHNGPFPYGQFFTNDTQYAGIGFYLRH